MVNSTAFAGVAQTVQHNVHIGTWTNWSRGGIMGATLTINRQYGSLVTAFTAFYVGVVASCFWRIICIVFHRIYSTPTSRDALHHQRQVVLRNSSSAASGLWTSLQLAWAWRGTAKAPVTRTLPTMICAALSICAFTAAGGFSSWISSGIGDEVLIEGSNCAIVEANSFFTVDTASVLSPYISQTTNDAANYAQQCYSANTTGVLDCTSFIQDHLEATVDTQALCPFADNLCRSNDSNIRLDSGFIDSSRDLGLNTPVDERFLYREVLHCAPLVTSGFASNTSTSYDNYTRYWYGPNLEAAASSNFTSEFEDLDAQYLRQLDNAFRNAQDSDLRLNCMVSATANGSVWDEESAFGPIPELFRSDGDVSLVFLSGNGVHFLEETNDPWYRGNVPGGASVHFTELNGTAGSRSTFQPQEAASPMGCVIQYQYCNANNQCGQLASFADACTSASLAWFDTIDGVWNDDRPVTPATLRFDWFQAVIASGLVGLGDVLAGLGSFALLSRQNLESGFMGPLPDNQWQLDVTHWLATKLASYQGAFVNAASGPQAASLVPFSLTPTDAYAKTLCNNQKILSTDFTSFNLFGLYFTFVTGTLIIIISYSLDPLFSCLLRRKGYKYYTFLEWSTNGTLQLQRLAYQGLGSGSWSGYTDTIPMTQASEDLGSLPLAYATVPKISQASSPSSTPQTSRCHAINVPCLDDAKLISLQSRTVPTTHQALDMALPVSLLLLAALLLPVIVIAVVSARLKNPCQHRPTHLPTQQFILTIDPSRKTDYLERRPVQCNLKTPPPFDFASFITA